MKIILFSGTHPRHLFVNRQLLQHFEDLLVLGHDRALTILALLEICPDLRKLTRKSAAV